MGKVDFSICPFIKNELNYLTYYDFCKNARIFKNYFKKFSKEEKIFYKWYVYANVHMDECYKNYILDYLNSDEQESYTQLIEGLNKYKAK